MVENEDQAVNELMEETEARLRQLLGWQKHTQMPRSPRSRPKLAG
jgi:hypothetical protein